MMWAVFKLKEWCAANAGLDEYEERNNDPDAPEELWQAYCQQAEARISLDRGQSRVSAFVPKPQAVARMFLATTKTPIAKISEKSKSHMKSTPLKDSSNTRQEKAEELVLSKQPVQPRELDVLRRIGRGAFGTVYLARILGGGGALFAVKCIRKSRVIAQRGALNVKRERGLTRELDSHFILKLRAAFQTSNALYLATDYYPGGSLADLLKKFFHLSLDAVCFYGIEIVLALEYLRERAVVHRDIKPSNILIDTRGHIAIADFGVATSGSSYAKTLLKRSASEHVKPQHKTPTPPRLRKAFSFRLKSSTKKDKKQDDSFHQKKQEQQQEWLIASGFHGTPVYTAPELLTGQVFGHQVDWWACGCTLYELRFGRTPFAADLPRTLFKNILNRRIPNMPLAKTENKALQTLLQAGLLVLDPKRRLASLAQAKETDFFKSVDWSRAATHDLKNPMGPPKLPSFISLDENDNIFYNDDCTPTHDDGPTISTARRAYIDEEISEQKLIKQRRRSTDTPPLSGLSTKSAKLTPRVKLFRGFALDPEFNLDAKPEDYTACIHGRTWA